MVKSLGMRLTVEIPEFPYGAMTTTIIIAEAGVDFPEDLVRSGKVDELADHRQAQGLKTGLDISAVEYLRAMRVRAMVQDAFRELFLDVDFLLTPTLQNTAPDVTAALDSGPALATAPKSRGLNGLIKEGNLRNSACALLPCRICGSGSDRDYFRWWGRPFLRKPVDRDRQSVVEPHRLARRRPPVT